MRSFLRYANLIPTLMLASCVTYTSGSLSTDTDQSAIGYYLPSRAIIVTLGPQEKNYRDVSFSMSQNYADAEYAFQLNPKELLFGKASTELSVSKFGLLSRAEGKSDIKMKELGQAIGGAVGKFTMPDKSFTLELGEENDNCPKNYALKYVIYPKNNSYPTVSTFCGVEISIEAIGATNKVQKNVMPTTQKPGIYYRVQMPYLIRAIQKHDKLGVTEKLVAEEMFFSPIGSPTFFAPAHKSLFSSASHTNAVLDEGILLSFDAKWDSEVLGFLKFPADVIEGYIETLTASFKDDKGLMEAERANIESQKELEIARALMEKCKAAVKGGEQKEIEKACE